MIYYIQFSCIFLGRFACRLLFLDMNKTITSFAITSHGTNVPSWAELSLDASKRSIKEPRGNDCCSSPRTKAGDYFSAIQIQEGEPDPFNAGPSDFFLPSGSDRARRRF